MKKTILSLIIIGLVLVGCATVPLTPDGQSFEGIWVKEDGTKLTITKNKWELVACNN